MLNEDFTSFHESWVFLMASRMLSREGNGTPLQYSCLENPMGRGAWWAAVHGVAKSRTRLSSFTFTFHFRALEKDLATHSSVLAWRIPGTGEPGGLPSMGSHRVGHDWSDLAAAAAHGMNPTNPATTCFSPLDQNDAYYWHHLILLVTIFSPGGFAVSVQKCCYF